MKTDIYLQLLTVCQGVWVLWFTSFIMYYYTHKSIKDNHLEKNALLIGLSYMSVSLATVYSAWNIYHPWFSLWTFLVIIGYTLGDIVSVRLMIHIHKNKRAVHSAKNQANISDEEFKKKRDELRGK